MSWSAFLRIVALILFILAVVQTAQGRWPRANLIAAGLAAWVLSTLVNGGIALDET